MSLAEVEANDLDPGAWPILTDKDGNVTEGSGYNVFIVTDGVIRTPTDTAILAGISRDMVLDLAEQLEVPASEEDLQPYDVYTADECFSAARRSRYSPSPTLTGGPSAMGDQAP